MNTLRTAQINRSHHAAAPPGFYQSQGLRLILSTPCRIKCYSQSTWEELGPTPVEQVGWRVISCCYSSSENVQVSSYDTTYSPESSPAPSPMRVFTVDDYGARADGSDDRKAFVKVWEEACSSFDSAVILVPEMKTYLLKPVTFSGPCRAHITLMIKGTLEASSEPSVWSDEKDKEPWIKFKKIRNLLVQGGGTLNGNGHIWWQNSCKTNKSMPCFNAPTALYFSECKDLTVEDLKIRDSQQIHLVFGGCSNVEASRLKITAPEWSPNTDGIHVTSTKNMLISYCSIGTGDDCISIVNGSRNIKATNILCGPGHGISIGSLGANRSIAHVSNVIVEKAILKNTTNGVRIKTWQGGHGYVRNIIFQDVSVHNVSNPIIINQSYCDSMTPCHTQKSAVAISNVLYKNIKGISASETAVRLNCSRTVGCKDVELQNIDLFWEDGDHTYASCNNVQWTGVGRISPRCT
ncbi:polygalacturonase QRT2-like [Typha angustifolia]|uniref:polygalacturonase QRT2-like n=1 Tax=Typha angustifolia TaxID=59011 RepID=UPI003C2E4899